MRLFAVRGAVPRGRTDGVLLSMASPCGSTAQRALLSTFRGANRVQAFGPSVFSEFTQLCIDHKAVNLGQGFPDFETPAFVKAAAQEAIATNVNQYTRSMGHVPLVQTLAQLYSPLFQRPLDALSEIVTTSGATEAGFATCQALINPGDEVIIMEPFYDMYPAQVTMAGGVPVYVPLRAPANATSAAQFVLDYKELARAITPRTRALFLNTPHNPLGKVWTRDELQAIADIVLKHKDLYVISDEVYEFTGLDPKNYPHVRIATLPGMWERVVTLGSAGKTFSVTGWKVGWTIAPANLSKAIFMAHQWIPFCVSSPLQHAVSQAFQMAQKNNYFAEFTASMHTKRQKLYDGLAAAGLRPIMPQGGYFVMADTSSVERVVPVPAPAALPADGRREARDYEICKWLLKTVGVGAIPPSAFYSLRNAPLAKHIARFAYCKRDDVIDEAAVRLTNLRKHLQS